MINSFFVKIYALKILKDNSLLLSKNIQLFIFEVAIEKIFSYIIEYKITIELLKNLRVHD